MRSPLVLTALVTAALVAGCGGKPPAAHWPRSAGAITADDPAEDGGESLEPHRVSEEAAAVEHGGEDITSILDQPAVPPPVTPSPTTTTAPPVEAPPESLPIFDEIIIVN